MDIADRLSNELLKQEFHEGSQCDEMLLRYRRIARGYAVMENAIAVLSDLHNDMSYVYYGRFARTLGLAAEAGCSDDTPSGAAAQPDGTHREQNIRSIWERGIFARIHPDDLRQKHLHELRFFHFVKGRHKSRRADFHMASRLRMKLPTAGYTNVLHRIFYIPDPSRNSLRLALCLYTPLTCDMPAAGVIIDSTDGTVTDIDTSADTRILSPREKQILRMINSGLPSKEIARRLSISIHTVSRHRQQILGKLQAKNSIEACQTAKSLQIL